MSVFNSSLTFSLPTKIDRYDCSDATHQYCYNGDLIKTDIFGNNVALEGEEYLHGTTYTHQERRRVYIKILIQPFRRVLVKRAMCFMTPIKHVITIILGV